MVASTEMSCWRGLGVKLFNSYHSVLVFWHSYLTVFTRAYLSQASYVAPLRFPYAHLIFGSGDAGISSLINDIAQGRAHDENTSKSKFGVNLNVLDRHSGLVVSEFVPRFVSVALKQSRPSHTPKVQSRSSLYHSIPALLVHTVVYTSTAGSALITSKGACCACLLSPLVLCAYVMLCAI